MRLLADVVVTTLAPGDCRVCSTPLVHAGDCPICPGCLQALIANPLLPGCRICSESLSMEPDADNHLHLAGLCQRCAAEKPKFLRATAWGDYEDLRPAIHMLKFEGVPGLSRPLGWPLAQAILAHREGAPALAVVPVPLYRRKRDYNQSLLLARSALRHVRIAAPQWSLRLQPGLLKRIVQTESQYLLSPSQRQENVRNAFAASPRAKGLHILLVDDVYTTGATAAECTRVLLRAGAGSVRIATLARAVREGAVRWRPQLAAVARDGPPSQPELQVF